MIKYWLIICLAMPVFCYGLKADYAKPVQIESASGEVNLKTHDIAIDGDVIVTQGTIKINGNQITFKQKAKSTNIINVYGTPVIFYMTLDSKNSAGKNQIFKGRASQVLFNSKTGIVNLIGNAKVKIDQDQIEGDHIIYNTITEQFVVKSDTKSRVKMTIFPKK